VSASFLLSSVTRGTTEGRRWDGSPGRLSQCKHVRVTLATLARLHSTFAIGRAEAYMSSSCHD
jgi:hypothetical protein